MKYYVQMKRVKEAPPCFCVEINGGDLEYKAKSLYKNSLFT